MRDKQPPGTDLPTIEETNQTRTVKMPVKSQDSDKIEMPAIVKES